MTEAVTPFGNESQRTGAPLIECSCWESGYGIEDRWNLRDRPFPGSVLPTIRVVIPYSKGG
jgi:hypothetical protein